jgi:hypothetical protein
MVALAPIIATPMLLGKQGLRVRLQPHGRADRRRQRWMQRLRRDEFWAEGRLRTPCELGPSKSTRMRVVDVRAFIAKNSQHDLVQQTYKAEVLYLLTR